MSSGGATAQSVEHTAPDQEVMDSSPAPSVRSLLVGSVSVKCDRLRQKSWSPHSVSVWQRVNLSGMNLATHVQDRLIAGKDAKKLNKQVAMFSIKFLWYTFCL